MIFKILKHQNVNLKLKSIEKASLLSKLSGYQANKRIAESKLPFSAKHKKESKRKLVSGSNISNGKSITRTAQNFKEKEENQTKKETNSCILAQLSQFSDGGVTFTSQLGEIRDKLRSNVTSCKQKTIQENQIRKNMGMEARGVDNKDPYVRLKKAVMASLAGARSSQ